MRTPLFQISLLSFAGLFSTTTLLAATLVQFSGDVNIVGDKEIREVRFEEVPLTLLPGARVSTGSSGKAKIKLDDDSEITLAPGAEVDLPSPVTDQPLAVQWGMVRILVKKIFPNRPFKVRTPTAVMGVRGTEFIVHGGHGHTHVCAFSGVVDVETSKSKAPVAVTAGTGVLVLEDGKISNPVTMDLQQMDWWREETVLSATSDSASESDIDSANRVARQSWWWTLPPTIETLDPAPLHHHGRWDFGGEFWVRLLNSIVPKEVAIAERINLFGSIAATPWLAAHIEGGYAPKWVMLSNPNYFESKAFLRQAFFVFRHRASHSFHVGRQEWNFGDGLIVGRDPWRAVARSFDGAMLTLRATSFRWRLFAGIPPEPPNEIAGYDVLAGSYLDFSGLPIEAYGFLNQRRPRSAPVPAAYTTGRILTIGQRFRPKPISIWRFQEEAAVQMNDARRDVPPGGKQRASILTLETGIEFDQTWILANYLYASSKFVPLYPDSHRFLGIANVFGDPTNVQRFGIFTGKRVLYRSSPLFAELNFFHFIHGRTADGTLGNEVDFLLGAKFFSNVTFETAFAYFWPGEEAPRSKLPGAFVLAQTRVEF